MIGKLVLGAVSLVLTGLLAASTARAGSGDPLEGDEWGLVQIGAPVAWRHATGAGVTVAIVDTGVDYNNPDLSGQLLRGASFLGCGARSCGTGSWRDLGPASQVPTPHGTEIAGVIAAKRNNGIGISGVAPRAKILSVNVGSMDEDDLARGIQWAADHGADVINLSLVANSLGLSDPVRNAIRAATSRGVVVVAAAGNSTLPICQEPAEYTGVLCVVAVDKGGMPARYSDLALKPDMNVVAAPGGDGTNCSDEVITTYPLSSGRTHCGMAQGGVWYSYDFGTSMATAYVTGAVALLLSQDRSPTDAVHALISTAEDPFTGSRGHYEPIWGYGEIDTACAVSSPE